MARRKKAKKAVYDYTKNPLFDLEAQTKKAILAILFFGFAIIVILSIWHKAGPFGEMIFGGFHYLFGWGYFVLPVVFLMMAFEFLKSRRKHIFFATIFGAVLLFVSTLGTLELLFPNKDNAGMVGYITALSLGKVFGFWASLVLLFAFVLISLVMVLNIPLRIGRDEEDEDEEENEEEEEENEEEVAEPIVNQAIKEGKRATALEKPSSAKATEGREEDEFKIPRFVGGTYKAPVIDLLESVESRPMSGDIKANANIIKRTLQHFGIDVEMG